MTDDTPLIVAGLIVAGLGGAVAAALGLLLAVPLGLARFHGRGLMLSAVEAWRGMPSVVIGLLVLAVARPARPAGVGIVVVAQAALATPLVAALAARALARAREAYGQALFLTGIGAARRAWLLAGACRAALARACVAGFARALGTAGAVLVLGGRSIAAQIAVAAPDDRTVLTLGLALAGASLVLSGLVMLLAEGEP
jgi:tungstate transport system permease protein